LVCWQRHGGQNTNDGHHDHQFNQGETLLCFLQNLHVDFLYVDN